MWLEWSEKGKWGKELVTHSGRVRSATKDIWDVWKYRILYTTEEGHKTKKSGSVLRREWVPWEVYGDNNMRYGILIRVVLFEYRDWKSRISAGLWDAHVQGYGIHDSMEERGGYPKESGYTQREMWESHILLLFCVWMTQTVVRVDTIRE